MCQAHGLNHMRFHSHCPPEAAFVAADQLGFYFQVECGFLGQSRRQPWQRASRLTNGFTQRLITYPAGLWKSSVVPADGVWQ